MATPCPERAAPPLTAPAGCPRSGGQQQPRKRDRFGFAEVQPFTVHCICTIYSCQGGKNRVIKIQEGLPMIRNVPRNTAFAACLAVTLLIAADPWKAKKPSEWNDKEATHILTNSPWAKTASVDMGGMGGSGMGRGGGGGGRRGGGGGGMSGGGGMGGGGYGGPGGGGGGEPGGPGGGGGGEYGGPSMGGGGMGEGG